MKSYASWWIYYRASWIVSFFYLSTRYIVPPQLFHCLLRNNISNTCFLLNETNVGGLEEETFLFKPSVVFGQKCLRCEKMFFIRITVDFGVQYRVICCVLEAAN